MRLRTIFTLVTAVGMLDSCTYKELCYSHPHYATVDVQVDWSQSRFADFDDGELPTGMTVIAYRRGEGKPVTISTNDIHHASLNLSEGIYDILLFDYSFIEFGSLEFFSQDSFADICATTAATKAKWYSKADTDGAVTRTPEWLATARIQGLEVIDSRQASLQLTPLSAVKNTRIVIHADGFHNLASVRAVAGGFAKTYMPGTDVNAGDKTAHVLSGWEAIRSQSSYKEGTISTVFQTFGFPDGFREMPEDLTLRLECLLVDGTTIATYDLDMGHLVQRLDIDEQNNIDYLIELHISLPDVRPQDSTGGGFSIKVEDWDEELVTGISIL